MSGLKRQQEERPSSPVAQTRSEHCHDEAASGDTQAKSLGNPSTNCHGDSCVPKDITAPPAAFVSDLSSAPIQILGSRTPDRIVSTQSEPLMNTRSLGSTAGFLDVLVLAGTLRI